MTPGHLEAQPVLTTQKTHLQNVFNKKH